MWIRPVFIGSYLRSGSEPDPHTSDPAGPGSEPDLPNSPDIWPDPDLDAVHPYWFFSWTGYVHLWLPHKFIIIHTHTPSFHGHWFPVFSGWRSFMRYGVYLHISRKLWHRFLLWKSRVDLNGDSKKIFGPVEDQQCIESIISAAASPHLSLWRHIVLLCRYCCIYSITVQRHIVGCQTCTFSA